MNPNDKKQYDLFHQVEDEFNKRFPPEDAATFTRFVGRDYEFDPVRAREKLMAEMLRIITNYTIRDQEFLGFFYYRYNLFMSTFAYEDAKMMACKKAR
jgi:hypothetical protein